MDIKVVDNIKYKILLWKNVKKSCTYFIYVFSVKVNNFHNYQLHTNTFECFSSLIRVSLCVSKVLNVDFKKNYICNTIIYSCQVKSPLEYYSFFWLISYNTTTIFFTKVISFFSKVNLIKKKSQFSHELILECENNK